MRLIRRVTINKHGSMKTIRKDKRILWDEYLIKWINTWYYIWNYLKPHFSERRVVRAVRYLVEAQNREIILVCHMRSTRVAVCRCLSEYRYCCVALEIDREVMVAVQWIHVIYPAADEEYRQQEDNSTWVSTDHHDHDHDHHHQRTCLFVCLLIVTYTVL